jgi:hypothetical protein
MQGGRLPCPGGASATVESGGNVLVCQRGAHLTLRTLQAIGGGRGGVSVEQERQAAHGSHAAQNRIADRAICEQLGRGDDDGVKVGVAGEHRKAYPLHLIIAGEMINITCHSPRNEKYRLI